MDEHQIREDLLKAKLAKLEALQAQLREKEVLPHRHLLKYYPWQREWLECMEPVQSVTAANQVGKSSTMIRKCIEWATNKTLWPKLWPEKVKKQKINPSQFWYLYPSREMATTEFYDKWLPLLPKCKKGDPEWEQYGWTEIKPPARSGSLIGVKFNSGVSVYFKTYTQGLEHLQAGTAWAVFCDEELPVDLLPEIQARVNATNGYLIFGFTATLAQEFWRQVMEVGSKWPKAWKRQISLYDCQVYDDGQKTQWTKSRIQQVIDNCTSEAEVQRRVFGKFVKDEGLLYSAFSRDANMVPWEPVTGDWLAYVGIDFGSQKKHNGRAHLSSICFLIVSPRLDQIRLLMAWRGREGEEMTAADLVERYQDMALYCKHKIGGLYYDFSAVDVGTIANRMGLPFEKADKNRDRGVTLLNSAFKDRVLLLTSPSEASLREGIPSDYLQSEELASELSNLGMNESKSRPSVHDDMVDALRYALIKIPVDWDEVRLKRAERMGLLSKVQSLRPTVHPLGSPQARLAYWNGTDIPAHMREETIEDEIAFWDGIINGE